MTGTHANPDNTPTYTKIATQFFYGRHKPCALCRTPAKEEYKCRGCHKTPYCSLECQEKDKANHATDCGHQHTDSCGNDKRNSQFGAWLKRTRNERFELHRALQSDKEWDMGNRGSLLVEMLYDEKANGNQLYLIKISKKEPDTSHDCGTIENELIVSSVLRDTALPDTTDLYQSGTEAVRMTYLLKCPPEQSQDMYLGREEGLHAQSFDGSVPDETPVKSVAHAIKDINEKANTYVQPEKHAMCYHGNVKCWFCMAALGPRMWASSGIRPCGCDH